MSYLVLARKWRPQTFEEVIGQGHVTRTLQNAIKNHRLAHALLFSGPRGVGKTSVARILAKAINCVQGNEGNPCNACEICSEITAGSSMDVFEIDGASNRGIDEIRQLRETVRFLPVRCTSRVYIIDEVHMLTKEAFNALLKTLEEPPAHVFFIFATTEPNKVLPTIHSRCQHFGFRRLRTRELADHILKIAQAEDITLAPDAAALLAREAEGGVRDGLSLLDQVAAFGASSIQEVSEALGVTTSTVLQEISRAILHGDAPAALRLVQDVYDQGIDLQKFLADLVGYFRDLAVIATFGPEKALAIVDIAQDEIEAVARTLSGRSHHDLVQRLDVLARGQESLHRSSTPRISLEILLMRACSMEEIVGIDALIERIDALAAGPLNQPALHPAGNRAAVTPQKTPSGPIPTPDTEVSGACQHRKPSITDLDEFLAFVRTRKPPLASLLEHCSERKTDDEAGSITWIFSSQFHADLLREKENAANLTSLALSFWGRPVAMVIQSAPSAGKDTPAQGGPSLRQELMQNPLVTSALEVFQARIAEVTPSSPKAGKHPSSVSKPPRTS